MYISVNLVHASFSIDHLDCKVLSPPVKRRILGHALSVMMGPVLRDKLLGTAAVKSASR
jgi:hypothetical protein